jgi:hypothetical protein
MYFLVPREVSADSVTLWVAAFDEAGDLGGLQLTSSTTTQPGLGNWATWPAPPENPRIRYQEVRIAGLQPRQLHRFQLQENGVVLAEVQATTLPTELPTAADKPFTVLLGSCFAHHEDKHGNVGKTFQSLPPRAKPDVKLLAGDQVYLDSPWQRFLSRHSRDELLAALLDQYVSTWGQADGFKSLLSNGGNFFCSDDHEFWNNAPNFVAFAQNTWTEAGRREWWDLASQLYSVFQKPGSISQFDVSPVSFLVLDTRIHRDAERKNFVDPADMQRLQIWIRGLKGPGVLVVGQPILQTATGFFKGHFGDWNLPDFEQYADLVRILGRSEHTIVVLTGDVHFGRVARSSLRSGAELIEIISSPMSLVDEKARGDWTVAPDYFPAEHTTPSSISRSGVTTESDFAPTEGHFLTVEFTKRGPGANVGLRFWPVLKDGLPSPDFGKTVWQRTIR